MSGLVSVVEDAERLVPWVAANAGVIDTDPRIETAVRTALGLPRPDVPIGTPMLVFANGREPALPLLDALISGTLGSPRRRCDCCTGGYPENRLWVGAGATVVELHLCTFCRRVLDFANDGLVWR